MLCLPHMTVNFRDLKAGLWLMQENIEDTPGPFPHVKGECILSPWSCDSRLLCVSLLLA